ncbi:hypothetical protein PAPYR_8290 [Paratrimastix pyriformis]|uniref:Uncharacterized protein n=1 Tax=Paratrimastix pyriformis TaxID=342808 RepID=A0ABQ8UI30_9EUKA|nr:hypothetical protein PAPYR_8290 [Paratrimastix pyriformis]|eukprot:GAFH01001711.1.p1 GENE.GAFH01001711.1~~GAFH01001711.1.p1  ORF type:complete len:325 (+),score=53.88 GAFH01001711.1:32-1006(+)
MSSSISHPPSTWDARNPYCKDRILAVCRRIQSDRGQWLFHPAITAQTVRDYAEGMIAEHLIESFVLYCNNTKPAARYFGKIDNLTVQFWIDAVDKITGRHRPAEFYMRHLRNSLARSTQLPVIKVPEPVIYAPQPVLPVPEAPVVVTPPPEVSEVEVTPADPLPETSCEFRGLCEPVGESAFDNDTTDMTSMLPPGELELPVEPEVPVTEAPLGDLMGLMSTDPDSPLVAPFFLSSLPMPAEDEASTPVPPTAATDIFNQDDDVFLVPELPMAGQLPLFDPFAPTNGDPLPTSFLDLGLGLGHDPFGLTSTLAVPSAGRAHSLF